MIDRQRDNIFCIYYPYIYIEHHMYKLGARKEEEDT